MKMRKPMVYSNKFTNIQVNNIIKKINKYGYVKIDNFLKKKNTNFFLDKINKIYSGVNTNKKINYAGVPQRDQRDKIIYSLFNKDICFNDLIIDPLLKKICINKLNDPYYRFLPPQVPNYTLNYFNARSSGNKLDLHIDSYFPFIGNNSTLLQASVILEDSYEKNGCTVIVPKSHQSGKFTNRKSKDVKSIIAKKGDLVLWDSRLWHGTKENITGESRWAIIMTFGQWWIKPSIDIVRAIEKKMYKKLNDEQKQILGFCSIVPSNEFERINTKSDYSFLKKNLSQYKL